MRAVPITNSDKRTGSKGQITVLSTDNGKTVIHKEVVAQIAGLVVREVAGVRKLVSFSPTQTVTSLAKSFRKGEKKDVGVQVEVGEQETAVDVRIVAEFGASIPHVAEQIRTSLGNQIYAMTGLRVVEVNIDVVDLYFAMDEKARGKRAS